jgi:nucleoside-diphosphate-sugar epimerase
MFSEKKSVFGIEELEERLSRPTDADVHALASLRGDILIVGAGGKMGPTLARLARRAAQQGGSKKRIIAVARFADRRIGARLEKDGIETISSDLLQPGALSQLPEIENVVFMAARKFGTTGSEHLTWAINTHLPGLVAERFRNSRIVVFSTGNVYGLRPANLGGADESWPAAPDGEYAQSALGRERMFQYGSSQWATPVVILRLNYAVELRYGVLVDIAFSVYNKRPIDLRMGLVNIIWQRDANSICLRSFLHCQSPPLILNMTGPETLSVRYIAHEFGRRFGVAPIFSSEEASSALLNNSAKAHQLFGYPTVTPQEMMDWVAEWVLSGGELLSKPTNFEVQDGKF